jgi:acetyl esterase/lipase
VQYYFKTNILLRKFIGLLFIFVLNSFVVFAQPTILKVWTQGVPGAIADPNYHEDTVYTETGLPRIRHVTDPELYVFFPPKDSSVHTAVIICPGGAYARLAIDHEGIDAAKWLTHFGITGIVLKYRLPSDTIMKEKSIGPLQDVQEAIRIVRRKSVEWNLDPREIGVMGFSAGGHLAATASTLYGKKTYDATDTTSARPDFSILIYGVISMQNKFGHEGSRKNLLGTHPDSAFVDLFSAELQVDAETPPAFIVHSANDPTVPVASSIAYFSALKKYSIPAELHIYETGGHGYGITGKGGTESHWTDACLNWMKAHGYITEP